MSPSRRITVSHSEAYKPSGMLLSMALIWFCWCQLAFVRAEMRVPGISEPSGGVPMSSTQHIQQQQQVVGPNNGASVSSSVGLSQPPDELPPKLPKINIYISKNEIKKILGIDTRINYVTNGIINSYPLAFTIPLGINQSDVIFTWQNLGQTNVNYSISLIIMNRDAVKFPQINITRNGLIPKQEQVFKITLPCTGSVTDEVDIQVLINITGYVETAPPSEPTEQLASAPTSALQSGPIEQTSGGATDATSANSSATNDSMQSDQADSTSGAPKLQPVSHTLSIKRKKICTQHPVQVASSQPTRLSEPIWTGSPRRPQQQQQPQQSAPMRVPTAGVSRMQPPAGSSPASEPQTIGNKTRLQQAPSSGQDQPESSSVSASSQLQQQLLDSLNEMASVNGNSIATPPAHLADQLSQQPHLATIASTAMIGRTAHNEALLNHWPAYLAPSAIPAENPLNDIMQPKRQSFAQSSASNPLLLTLIALSLVVSLALVVVVLLSSSAHKRAPFDKLSAITGCLLRRAPASVQAANGKCKSPMASAVISSLRAGPKSTDSVVSTISGKSHSRSKQPAYCFKTNCHTANGYYTTSHNSASHFQHHYQQHPPTADLLGTGYQCQPVHSTNQQQQPPPPHYPIYHIAAGSNSQTTRLIWNNGNGTSPDGFRIDGGTYMPLSNNARSDSGSVYQTIY